MSTHPSATATVIPGYNLEEPTERDALAALQRVFGAAKAETHWAAACADAALRHGRVKPGAELAKAADALKTQGGAAAVVARSIEIRMHTYYRFIERDRSLTGRDAS